MAFDGRPVPPDPIQWDACSEMYARLQSASRETCAGVVQISSFNCGCDSITMEIYRNLLRDKGIPYLTLVLDEHTSQTGIDTRLEAFVDSTTWVT
jgi:predicted nucleotide-binding protein (sugar kinase/HSP70/actin superfamily)